MKAEDTVMGIAEHKQALKEWEALPAEDEVSLDDFLFERQAKIAFKAGYKQAVLHTGDINAKLALAYEEDMKQHKLTGIKEVVDEFSKWFKEQSWDINGGAYVIPKIVLDRKLLMLKEPFKPSSKNGA